MFGAGLELPREVSRFVDEVIVARRSSFFWRYCDSRRLFRIDITRRDRHINTWTHVSRSLWINIVARKVVNNLNKNNRTKKQSSERHHRTKNLRNSNRSDRTKKKVSNTHDWVMTRRNNESATMTSTMSLLQWHEWVCYNDSSESALRTRVSLLQWHLQWVCYNDIYSEFATMTRVSLLQ